jgi:metal-responsive CopG/Arc/MetJ family transcriptional regulator
MRTTTNVCLTLPPETLAKIDKAARRERRSRSQFVTLVLDAAVVDSAAPQRETTKELENGRQ